MRIKDFIGSFLVWFGTKISPDAYTKQVQIISGETAKRIVIDYLNREGILHCALCPRRGTLRKSGELYYCESCYTTLKRGVKNGQTIKAG